jgi:hypothetical protein
MEFGRERILDLKRSRRMGIVSTIYERLLTLPLRPAPEAPL